MNGANLYKMFDVIRLLDEYNVEYSLSGENTSEDFVNIKCVFCDDPKNHLGVRKDGLYSNCWMCGKHSIEDTLTELLGLKYFEVIDLINEYSGRYDIRLNKKERIENKKLELPGEELKNMHREYLIKRGFDPDYIIKKYKIKGTGFTGRWKYRIMIPIFYKNRLVSYQGRDITNKQKLRYDTLSKKDSGFDLGTIFYGLDDIKNKDIFGLVEGSTDKWRMGNNFLAVLTSNLTEHQIKILCNFKRGFVIFDSEKKAYEKAKKIAEKLNSFKIECYIINLDKGKDPAMLKEEEVKYIRKEMGL